MPNMMTERGGGAAQIRVMIVDDHALFRQGVGRLLETAGMRVIAGARDGREGVRYTASLRPDVTLIDLDMPGLSGVQTIQATLQGRPASRIIALTSPDDPCQWFRAREAGAKGCLPKTARGDELVTLIRQVYAGEPVLDVTQHTRVTSPATATPLSVRECELLRLVAQGLGNHEIAQRLSVSEKTIRNRMSQTFAALKVHNRTQAAVYALRAGIAVLY